MEGLVKPLTKKNNIRERDQTARVLADRDSKLAAARKTGFSAQPKWFASPCADTVVVDVNSLAMQMNPLCANEIAGGRDHEDDG